MQSVALLVMRGVIAWAARNRLAWVVMVKVCGVVMTVLPGYSWAPASSIGQVVNVGTTCGRPPLRPARPEGGQAHRRLSVIRWGGGLVVVRGRESRLHGEGGQQAAGRMLECLKVRW